MDNVASQAQQARQVTQVKQPVWLGQQSPAWLAWLACLTCLAGCTTPAPEIETTTARVGTIQKVVAAQGRVEALSETRASSKIDGRILKILVQEGAKITEGQVLVQLDNDMAEVALAEAKARTDEALANLNRAKKMRAANAIPPAEYEMAEAQHEILRAKQQAAELFMRDQTIRAPIAGQVIHKHVEDGEFAKAGMPLVTVADLSKIFVRSEVDQTDIGYLQVGQQATITADGFVGKDFVGTIAELGQAVGVRKIHSEDPSKIQDRKVLEVKIALKDLQGLKLGMTVDVKIEMFKKEKVLMLPKRVIHQEKDFLYVEAEAKGKVVRKYVTTGIADDIDIEITKGLKEGDQVLVPSSGSR